jgi:Coenzyme PQQ synthesis protein D (PqqD)
MNPLIEQIKQNLSAANYSLNPMSDGSAVILDTRRERLLTLNASASLIIAAIQSGARSTDALAEHLQLSFAADRQTVNRDLERFLTEIDALLKV